MATKRNPSNTIDAALKAAVNATKPLHKPPEFMKLKKECMPFWEAIMLARAHDEWIEIDLVTAAQLAKCQFEIESHSQALEIEGHVVENKRGTPIMNPRHSVLEQLSRRQLALMRSLQIAGTSTGNRKDDLQKSRKIERNARKTVEEFEEDDLLA